MAKGDRITGSVFVAGRTFVEGDEAELHEHLEGLDAKTRASSLQHLANAGAIEGFGVKPVELSDVDPTIAASKKATRSDDEDAPKKGKR
jgi:hypothetical protein